MSMKISIIPAGSHASLLGPTTLTVTFTRGVKGCFRHFTHSNSIFENTSQYNNKGSPSKTLPSILTVEVQNPTASNNPSVKREGSISDRRIYSPHKFILSPPGLTLCVCHSYLSKIQGSSWFIHLSLFQVSIQSNLLCRSLLSINFQRTYYFTFKQSRSLFILVSHLFELIFEFLHLV